MSTEQTPAVFDFAAEIAALKNESTWQQSDRVARTLANRANLHVVLTVLKPGGRLAEHRAQAAVTIQTITSTLRVRVGGQSVELPTGQLLVLEPGTLHDVEADTESAFVLTITG